MRKFKYSMLLYNSAYSVELTPFEYDRVLFILTESKGAITIIESDEIIATHPHSAIRKLIKEPIK